MLTSSDTADRTQIRTGFHESVFIEAGAGTGKTSCIIDRVVSMVATGHLQLRELAAITFTEAAASELRDRVRAALEVAASGGDPLVGELAARTRCEQALDQLDEAALTTLHGFAQRILAEHPLEAGLPPGFEVLDEIRARITFEQHWAAFVDELFDDPSLERLLLHALALGIDPAGFHGIARQLHENHDRLPPPAAPLDLPPVRVDGVVRSLDELFVLRRDWCTDPDDRLARHIDGLVAFRDELGAASDELDTLIALREAPRLTCSNGRKANWGVPVDEVRAACTRLSAAATAILDGQRRDVLTALGSRVVEFVRTTADSRRRAGTLEFHDLLVLARDLLRRDGGVRAALTGRYRCLLLDEFQDTDPLQIEIATLLASDDPDAGTREWSEIQIRPGALVVVGDPKQSIYRFRRADLGVYHRARELLGLASRRLTENFRSVPGIVDFVNEVFSDLLDEVPGVQAGHVHLLASRPSTGTAPAVKLLGTPHDRRLVEIREVEAADIAAQLAAVKASAWPVYDAEEQVERAATYGDIAILVPSRTALPALEDALERADIPMRIESQSLIFSTAEVRDLLSALVAIDDPTDEIAIVATLRSPGFGCSDVELAEYATSHGSWDYRADPPPDLAPEHRVVAGLVALRELWSQRWWRTVSETVAAVIRDRRLLELAVHHRRPRDRWRRLRFLLDQARAWDDAGESSLRSFVAWAQEQADERARVVESVAPEPDDDAVRVLTVHGAKGLEFPIVVLAGLNVVPTGSPGPVVWGPTGPHYATGTKRAATRVTTDGYDEAARAESLHEAAERTRLLYVAMTRARDHLVVSLHHKEGTTCHAATLTALLEGSDHTTVDPGPPPDEPQRRSATNQPIDEPADREAWVAGRTRLLARASRPASVAATALASHSPNDGLRHPPGGDDEDPTTWSEAPWHRGRAGTAIGRAVHAVLQTIDLDTGGGLADTARAQALAEGIPEHEHEIRDLVASVLDTPIVRTVTAPGVRHWREVPVAAAIDGLLVEGFIDLLVEIDGDLVVVDYKTDRLTGDVEIDAALARYTPQGAAYALAVQEVLRRAVARCVFVFAAPDGAVEREVLELSSEIEAVRARVSALAT